MEFELENYINEFKQTSSDIVQRIDTSAIRDAVHMIHEARRKGCSVYTVGNGGSASTASHFCGDLFKWATAEGRLPIKALCLSDNVPLVSALTNDNGWTEIYSEQLKTHAQSGDVIVAFSVHGGSGKEKAGVWSQNITKAIDLVKQRGGSAIGFTGFDGGAMKDLCDVHVNVPIDSTPHVESMHLVLCHVIADGLKELALQEHAKQQGGTRAIHRV